MRLLPPGWATDLAVLELHGSTVVDRGDHLVISTPDNPGYHWGNFVFVSDEAAVDDSARWVATFRAAHPAAGWTAIGLVTMPRDVPAWTAQGLTVELDDVLTTRTLPAQTPLPRGYTARRLEGPDWEQALTLAVAENARTGEHEPSSFEAFVRARNRARRAMSDHDVAAFFGAFADGVLVAELGIVRCGATARYQSVGTDAAHRRRGLAGHLLGVAARWAGAHGCDQWVILTEATNPAGRLYRTVGFTPDTGNAQAFRPAHG